MSSSQSSGLIKRLQQEVPRGRPFSSKQLKDLGVSPELAYRYVHSGWIKRLSRGTFKFPGDELRQDDCLSALARAVPHFHVGGKTALAWQGFRHNVPNQETLCLWGPRNSHLPSWFTERFPARYTVKVLFGSQLPPLFGLQPLAENPTGVPVAVPERALLEMLSEVGVHQEVEEARHIMESVRSLRQDTLQLLLRACTQVKTLRLCAAWAKELELPWAQAANDAVVGRTGKGRWVKRLKNGHTLILKP